MAVQPSSKHTKILATIGPASNAPETMEAVVRAGTNGLRLNMSHGTHEEKADAIRLARRISKILHKPLAIVADLQGPKIRLGMLPDEGVVLRTGDQIQLVHGDVYEPGGPLPVQHDISKHVKADQPLFLRDGMIELCITKVSKGRIHATVLNNGLVFSKQGINLPETDFDGDILTGKDLDDLKFAAGEDVDYIALSFVQTAADIESLKGRIKRLGSDCKVIAKIETKAAVDNLEEIVRASDGVMVARGDLAIETRPERVPVVQKRIIELTRRYQKLAIVATQMLESMTTSPQPTRAEVSDVATAVLQGADAVMLSGESAVGKYPVETVAMMRRVITYTEANRYVDITADRFGEGNRRNAIAAAAITLAQQIDARVIIADTAGGSMARTISSFRPETLLVAVTHNVRAYSQLALVWGVRVYLIKDPAKAGDEILQCLRDDHNIKKGDVVVRASGQIPGMTGGTDTVQVEAVK